MDVNVNVSRERVSKEAVNRWHDSARRPETPTRNKDFAGTNASLKRFTSCFDSLEPCAGAQRSGHTSALAGAAVSQDTRHPREREGRASPAALTLIYRRERRKSSDENEGALSIPGDREKHRGLPPPKGASGAARRRPETLTGSSFGLYRTM